MTKANEQNDIRRINECQKLAYELEEERASTELLNTFADVLEKTKDQEVIKILDIGGASGHFALKVREYLGDRNCEVVVIDSSKYDTWTTFASKITFIEQSVTKLDEIFAANTFDVVFANRVFHHFVKNTWNKTVNGIRDVINQIAAIIKQDGYFCITEHFFDGLIYDKASSIIVFTLSSCTYKPVISLCKRVGVESAGIGVCFLSKKMWLKLLSKAGFVVESIEEQNWEKVKCRYKKMLFLNKKNTLDNIIISQYRATVLQK